MPNVAHINLNSGHDVIRMIWGVDDNLRRECLVASKRFRYSAKQLDGAHSPFSKYRQFCSRELALRGYSVHGPLRMGRELRQDGVQFAEEAADCSSGPKSSNELQLPVAHCRMIRCPWQ
eukprot:jgi/Mesvir1/25659/Mv01875-RA.1